MPHSFPADIQAILDTQMPPDYELFWVRCVVTQASMASLNQTSQPYTLLKVFDCDAAHQNINDIQDYEITLKGDLRKNKVQDYDAISFFGHRRKGENRIRPRFMLNHNTNQYYPAYYNVVAEDGHREHLLSAKELLDSWLTVSSKQNKAAKIKTLISFSIKYWLWSAAILIFCFWLAGPKFRSDSWQWIKEGDLSLQTIFGGLWFFWSLWIFFKNHSVDLEPIYASIMTPVNIYARQNQLPDVGFVINERR